MGPTPPAGTVTFVFTDIEGSTALLRRLGSDAYAAALAGHRRVVRECCARHDGTEVDTQGDAFFLAFPTALDAVGAAAEITTALADGPISVRVGLHTGTPLLTAEGYVGEDVHRAARIAACGHGGQVILSSATAALVDTGALVDLGEHRLRDLSAPQRLYQLGDREFPPLRTLAHTNLPVPATPFVGRARELAEVGALMARDDARLLTLTGPGGAGKTRLALQTVAAAADGFPDGVYWVPLAPLTDPALVVPSIAQALDVRDRPERALADEVAAAVAGRRLLLLLDSVEHLLPHAADAVSAIVAVPGPLVVVTSRERLQLPGEQVYPVPTLDEADGIALFASCARALDPGFTGGGAVAELCARLDELPLALELAAARTVVFSPEQLLERLSQRLDLLKAGRGTDPRQQTLRATIEWSYDLLELEEQRLLGALSVFAGGCSYEAAEEVAGAEPDTLQSLLDKSLLRRRDSELGPRYVMLETIRAFATETLDEEELRRLRDAHLAQFARIETLARAARRRDPDAIAFLRVEQANTLEALSWALETGAAEQAQKILSGAWFYWFLSGLAADGDRWASEVVALPSEPTLLGARALSLAGEFARFRGDPERALALKRLSMPIYEQLDPTDPDVRSNLASTLTDTGAILSQLGDFDAAVEHSERALAIRRESGIPHLVAHALAGLGLVQRRRGALDGAARLYAESIALSDAAGERFEPVDVLVDLGLVRRAQGDLVAAREAIHDGHERALASGDAIDVAVSRTALGILAADEGRLVEAVELLARGTAELDDLGATFDVAADAEAALDRCRAALGADAYEAAFAAGVDSASQDKARAESRKHKGG